MELSDTTAKTKKKVQNVMGVPPSYQQRLLFSRNQLEDHLTLSDYNIEKESTIHTILHLCGGAHTPNFGTNTMNSHGDSSLERQVKIPWLCDL